MKILYFASLREKIGKDFEEINGVKTLGELRKLLNSKYHSFDENILAAINLEMVNDENAVLSTNDEIAFYPPMTGG